MALRNRLPIEWIPDAEVLSGQQLVEQELLLEDGVDPDLISAAADRHQSPTTIPKASQFGPPRDPQLSESRPMLHPLLHKAPRLSR